MSFPPDVIPIEMRGMSIFTALIFGFVGIGFGFIWGIMKKDFGTINSRLNVHSKKLDERSEDITDIKINVAKTQISIESIEKILANLQKQSNYCNTHLK